MIKLPSWSMQEYKRDWKMAGWFYKSVTIKKKMNASEFADHRTIKLIENTSKIMLRLMGKRLESKGKYFFGKHSLDSEKDVEREKHYQLWDYCVNED